MIDLDRKRKLQPDTLSINISRNLAMNTPAVFIVY